jgi:RNAse (barnase) inhibitor barstar
MGKLLQRLQDPSKSGVYRARREDELADAVRGSTLDLATISLSGIRDKPELLKRIAATLAFPQWFGENWDALEDCLTDFSWRPAQGHVLLFENFQTLAKDDLGVLIDVLASAAQFRATQGTPFFAVFVDPARDLALADLFREA